MKPKHFSGERIDLTADFTISAIPKLEKEMKEIVTSKSFGVNDDMKYGEVEVVVSNSGLDRHGERILIEGIDFSRATVVLWSHEYSSLPIGKILKMWREGDNLMARFRLEHDIYTFADTVYKMILRGTVNAVSIGGLVHKWNEEFTVVEQMEMLELSVVPVGAHPDALVTAKSLGMKESDFKKQYSEFVNGAVVDKLKNLPQNSVESYIELLKTLTSALESSVEDTEEPIEVKCVKRIITVARAVKQCNDYSEALITAIEKDLKS